MKDVKDVIVTAHALLRYLERVYHLDIQAYRQAMTERGIGHATSDADVLDYVRDHANIPLPRIRQEIEAAVRPFLGLGLVMIPMDGYSFQIRDNIVKTVLTYDTPRQLRTSVRSRTRRAYYANRDQPRSTRA